MRHWFDEANGRAFAMEVPPPDGANVIEITEADYTEIVLASTKAPVQAPYRKEGMREYATEDRADAAQATELQPVIPPATMDMERLARIWRKMQDKRDQLKAEFESADLKIEEQQDAVSVVLLGAMNTMKADSLKTQAGVIERSEQTHANAADWPAIYRFIRENDQFEMLQKRLTTTAVLAWAKSHTTKDGQGRDVPTLPPGMNLFTKLKINVKKPAGKTPPKDGAN